MNFKAIIFGFSLVVMLFGASYFTPASAHYLYPDEECTPIIIHADIEEVKINWEGSLFEFDDPIGLGDGEVAIIYSFFESAHDQDKVIDRMYIDDWNYFIHNRVPFDNKDYHRDFPEHNVYVHTTCLEDLGDNHLIASFYVSEIDSTITNFRQLEERLWKFTEDQVKGTAFFTIFEANPYIVALDLIIGTIHLAVDTIPSNTNLGVAINPIDLGEEGVFEWEPSIQTQKMNEWGNAEITYRVWIEEQTCPVDFGAQDFTHNPTLVDYTKDPTIHFLGSNSHESKISFVQLESVIVPGWIKTNAQWWSDGLLSDSEFVSGIEYLVENGVITSPALKIIDAPSQQSSDGYTIPNNPQDVTEIPISGVIENPEFEEVEVLIIEYPDGSYEEKTILLDNGHFTTNFVLRHDSLEGQYVVLAGSDKKQILTFDAAQGATQTDSTSETSDPSIPEWIKNNAKWWAEGQIGDNDFVSGIEFMVEEKIITTPRIVVSEQVISTSPKIEKIPTPKFEEALPTPPDSTEGSQDEDLSFLSSRAETDPLLDPQQQIIRVVSKDVTIEPNEFSPGHTATYHWKLERDNGEPAADASVMLVQNDGRKYGPTKADSDGNVYYDRGEPGTWTLKIDSVYHPYVQNYGQYFAGCDEIEATIP